MADADDGRLGLYLGSVEELGRGIGLELTSLSERAERDQGKCSAGTALVSAALVGAALRSADLATLAACALPELPLESAVYPRTAAAARLAAAATQAIALEYRSLDLDGHYEERDLRGAEWRAGLAARQVEEKLREES